MNEVLVRCIYDREYYDIPYSEMGRWFAYMKDLSVFSYDCGCSQIAFSDAFSKYKTPNQC